MKMMSSEALLFVIGINQNYVYLVTPSQHTELMPAAWLLLLLRPVVTVWIIEGPPKFLLP